MITNSISGSIASSMSIASGGGALLELLFNGSNGSTTFTDTSSYARTITGNGSAAISTAQSVSGGSSLSLPDSSSYLEFAWSTPLTGDFTLSADVYPNSIGSDQAIFTISDGGTTTNLRFDIGGGGNLRASLRYDDGSSFANLDSSNTSATLSAGEWTNVSLIVLGTTVSIKINGSVVDSVSFSATREQGLTTVYVGRFLNVIPRNFVGYIDNLSITTP